MLRALALSITVAGLIVPLGTDVVVRPDCGSTNGADVWRLHPPSGTATTIDVNVTDALRIEPAGMTVPAGVPVPV